MKRYGDNLPSNHSEELESTSGEKIQYLAGNCAVRQDMVSFLMPADSPHQPRKRKAWNIFSFFKFGQKQIPKNGD
jgi:hypothetical protein